MLLLHDQEKHIIKGCLQKKAKAQRALYEAHASKMYALCLCYARSKADAEDMLQEGFLKVYRDLHQYRPEAPLGAWIRKVMVNTALEHIRKYRKKEMRSIDNVLLFDSATPEVATAELNAEALRNEIRRLPEEFRLVFNLFAIEGYSHGEISDMLDISVANSKVRLNRARNSLKKTIEENTKYAQYEK